MIAFALMLKTDQRDFPLFTSRRCGVRGQNFDWGRALMETVCWGGGGGGGEGWW